MPTTSSADIPQDEMSMFYAAENAVRDMIGIHPSAKPAEVVDQVHAFLAEYEAGQAHNSLGEDGQMAVGVTIANAIVRAYGWDWQAISHGDWQSIGVVDPDRKWLMLPVQYGIHLFERGLEDDAVLTPKMLFNCIGHPYLPDSEPGMFAIIAGG